MATTVNFDSFLPEGEHLFDYQQAGVAYALVQTAEGKGTWIADEQQLGKTRQAIVAAKVRDADKVLIICKSALKSNMEREVRRCAPEWSVQILNGTRPYETISRVCIISFDVLATWSDALVAEGFDALIIDESHYVKSLGTAKTPVQRTAAALKVAEDVRSRKGLVLLLSGTPLLNRPVELVTQLMIMGRLQDVTPRPSNGRNEDRDWEYSFRFTFCDPQKNDYGRWEFKGSSNLDLLNTRLRGTCMVRRLRNEVLGMVDTHRTHTPLSLNGGLDAYWETEATFQPKHPASAAVELLGKLRMAVGLAKIPAAVDWVQTFVEENPGKKLIVWAWHENVQQGVAKALNAAGIKAVAMRNFKSGTPAFQAEVDAFNTGDTTVLVCSLQAHREGLPLKGNGHNSTDSLFVEQPWHPGAVSQAEDRQQGVGQSEPVFATTLVVEDTVDGWLADLIADKWATFRAAADGTIPTGEELDIQNLLLGKLRQHMAEKYGKELQ